ncbi:MAG: hypothetical protein ACYC0F_18175 [Rhodanobacter sp.]
MLEGLSLSTIMPIVSMLGLPGLVMIFWYVDQRRITEAEARHLLEVAAIKEQFTAVMAASEKRFEAVVRMYEDNVLLVKGYERLAGELANIIHLNTQMQTRLVEKIESNMNCPIVRDGGFKKWALTANG